MNNADPLLTPPEVAILFKVNATTVVKWAREQPDKLPSVRTLGGQLRFKTSVVHRLLEDGPPA